MVKISEAFPSKYLANADLKGKDVVVTIDSIEMVTAGGDVFMVAHLGGTEKLLRINKSSATAMAAHLGDDTDRWGGMRIRLYPTTTLYQGKQWPVVSIDASPGADTEPPVPDETDNPTPLSAPLTPPAATDGGDSIPF